MTPSELKEWLSGSASQESGWSKDDGSGESIGHEACLAFQTKIDGESG
jgi:hypothetical protein